MWESFFCGDLGDLASEWSINEQEWTCESQAERWRTDFISKEKTEEECRQWKIVFWEIKDHFIFYFHFKQTVVGFCMLDCQPTQITVKKKENNLEYTGKSCQPSQDPINHFPNIMVQVTPRSPLGCQHFLLRSSPSPTYHMLKDNHL